MKQFKQWPSLNKSNFDKFLLAIKTRPKTISRRIPVLQYTTLWGFQSGVSAMSKVACALLTVVLGILLFSCQWSNQSWTPTNRCLRSLGPTDPRLPFNFDMPSIGVLFDVICLMHLVGRQREKLNTSNKLRNLSKQQQTTKKDKTKQTSVKQLNRIWYGRYW